MPKAATYPHLRFEAKIKKLGDDNKHWIWTGAKNTEGFGKFIMGSRKDGKRKFVTAHRYSYRFYEGPVSDHEKVFHRCDRNDCVNPKHLRVGSQSDVVRMAVKKRPWVQGLLLRKWVEKNKPDYSGTKNPNYRHGRYVQQKSESGGDL